MKILITACSLTGTVLLQLAAFDQLDAAVSSVDPSKTAPVFACVLGSLLAEASSLSGF